MTEYNSTFWKSFRRNVPLWFRIWIANVIFYGAVIPAYFVASVLRRLSGIWPDVVSDIKEMHQIIVEAKNDSRH